jgi:hypothetical protein
VGEKGMVQFALQAIQIQTDTNRALQTFRRAVKLIQSDEPPNNASCEYCRYLDDYVSRLG